MSGSQTEIPGRESGVSQFLFGNDKLAAEAQDEQDQATAKMVYGLLQEAKQWRENWARHWPRFWNEWEGNHFSGKIVHTLTRAVINQIFSSVETFIGHVCDDIPEPNCKARVPQNRQRADLITKWLKYCWDRSDGEQEITHPVRAAAVTGIGWWAVDWDEAASRGKGEPSLSPIDERFMFVSPHCRRLTEALYVIEAKNVPREYVVNNWAEGRLVPPGIWDGSLSNQRSFTGNTSDISAFANFTTTDGSQSAWTGASNQSMAQRNPKLVTLIKAWIKQQDGTMRYIVVSNGVVLQDGPSPYADDDFPYVVFNLIPTMDTIYGRSLVQFIEGLQELLDLSVSYLMDQQRYASDPMLIVDGANLMEAGEGLIDNMPGAVLPNVSQAAPGYWWMEAPGFNQAWASIQELLTGYMDSVLGRVDVLKGERPAGVNTLGGLEIVRDEANVRIRNLVRWVKASVKRSYLLVLSRLKQFATDERVLRITGKGGKEEFATVNEAQGVTPEGTLQQDMTIPDDAEFDIEFAKEVPGGRQARIELALQLATTPAEDGLPMVPRRYVLEQCDVEGAEEIVAEMQAAGQAAAEAAAQAEQAKSGAAGAPVEEDPIEAAMSLFGSGMAA